MPGKPDRGRGLKSIPSVVQLPGGIRLTGVMFRITSYDDDGCPKTFEVMPPGATGLKTDGAILWCNEEWLRSPVKPPAAPCEDPSHQDCDPTPEAQL